MSTYTAHVVRDGQYWHIHVPEIDRVTQARHLREVDMMARELISIITGEDPDTFELQIKVQRPAHVDEHLARVAQLREEMQRAQAAASDELRKAAQELRATKMPLRDIGELLGLSYQRVHQLVGSGNARS